MALALSVYDAERERIGRQLENGYLTLSQHRKLARAVDRAEAREADKKARAERRARQMAKARLRNLFKRSLEVTHA